MSYPVVCDSKTIRFPETATSRCSPGIAICASRLVAGSSLLGHFERTYYPLPGIADPMGLIQFVFSAT